MGSRLVTLAGHDLCCSDNGLVCEQILPSICEYIATCAVRYQHFCSNATPTSSLCISGLSVLALLARSRWSLFLPFDAHSASQNLIQSQLAIPVRPAYISFPACSLIHFVQFLGGHGGRLLASMTNKHHTHSLESRSDAITAVDDVFITI